MSQGDEVTQIIQPGEETDPVREMPDLVRNGSEAPPTSLIEQLRGLRNAETKEAHYDLDVPGYNGCLVLRLGPLGASFISKLRQRAEKSRSPDVDLNANLDVLIAGCREVLGRTARDAELEPLDEENDPTRIDDHLAELLQLGTTTARGSLLALWDKANAPEIAIGLAAGEYIEWSGETQADADEEFMGKT